MAKLKQYRSGFFWLPAAVLLLTVAVLLTAFPTPSRVSGAEKAPPNIILLVPDTLRPDHLGCYGSSKGLSPFIDFLAEGGVRFERVFSQSSWTKTSMASMLTACNPASHNILVRADRVAQSTTMLAERLRAQGYHCLGVQTNPWLTKDYGFNQGFDEYRYLKPQAAEGKSKPAYVTADQVVSFAADRAARISNRPLFLYVHLMDPHAPYDPPAAYRPEDPAGEQALYGGEVRFLDDQLRELYRKLGEIGLRRNTLFVLVSDHGEEFGEHGGTGHGQTLYREVLHVPLILHGDALDRYLDTRGKTVPQMVRLIDVAPTLIEVAGAAPLEGEADGRSVLPLINGWWPSDRPVFSQLGLNFNPSKLDDYFEIYSLSTRKGKFIINATTGSEEYFRLTADPEEQSNLSANPPRNAKKLKKRLEDYIVLAARDRIVAENTDPDTEQKNLDQLRALGYIADDSE